MVTNAGLDRCSAKGAAAGALCRSLGLLRLSNFSSALGLQDDAGATAGADPATEFVGSLPALGWNADAVEGLGAAVAQARADDHRTCSTDHLRIACLRPREALERKGLREVGRELNAPWPPG